MLDIKGKYSKDCKVFAETIEAEAMSTIYGICDHPAFKDAHIRIMPDCHQGKGIVIGFSCSVGDFVDPTHIGVDIGCFTGDTKIKLTDGRDLSFIELIDEYKNGKENFCYAINNDGNICVTKINNPSKTKTVNKLCEVTLDNGEIIKCTIDHKFMLRNGTYKEAKDLKENDSLMPLYINYTKNVVDLFNTNVKGECMMNYLAILNPSTNTYEYVHVLSDEYNNRYNLYTNNYNKSFVRHHIDFNKYNNNPTNLIRLSRKEHWKIHSDNIKETNKLGLTGFKRANELHPGLYSYAGHIGMTKNWQNDEFKINHINRIRKRNSDVNSKWYKYASSGKNKKRVAKLGKQIFGNQIRDDKHRDKMQLSKIIKICKGFDENNIEFNEKNYTVYAKKYSYNPLNWQNLNILLNKYNISFNYNDLKHVFDSIYINHKVVSINIIDVNPTDVYCLINQEYSNFALSSGVFVHNCQMTCIELSRPLTDKEIPEFEHKVKNLIPMGFNIHSKRVFDEKDFWKFINKEYNKARSAWPDMIPEIGRIDERYITSICKRTGMDEGVFYKSIGTVGGGNHFLEYGETDDNRAFFTIHCGSRNFGVKVCNYWSKVAKRTPRTSSIYNVEEEIKKVKATVTDRKLWREMIDDIKEHAKTCNPQGYLSGENLKGYLSDMVIATAYANYNHEMIQKLVFNILMRYHIACIDTIKSIHNYIDFEDHIIRKGAIRSYIGELMVIPFNMRDGMAICQGKSNDDWNCTAPHGAGRIMSRSAAKKKVSIDEFKESMKDVYSTTVCEGTLDESPMVYKDKDEIIKLIEPTAEILFLIKPKINIKATDGGE